MDQEKQRSLLGEPDLLILDELVNGFDPIGMRELILIVK